jgi:hypothetical protein
MVCGILYRMVAERIGLCATLGGRRMDITHVEKKLKEWGVEVPEGENAMSIYQSMLLEHGDHNFIPH